MVHLFFHHFFWVSNWNILDESNFLSYTLKGGEFDGKVFFCKKILSISFGGIPTENWM